MCLVAVGFYLTWRSTIWKKKGKLYSANSLNGPSQEQPCLGEWCILQEKSCGQVVPCLHENSDLRSLIVLILKSPRDALILASIQVEKVSDPPYLITECRVTAGSPHWIAPCISTVLVPCILLLPVSVVAWCRITHPGYSLQVLSERKPNSGLVWYRRWCGLLQKLLPFFNWSILLPAFFHPVFQCNYFF